MRALRSQAPATLASHGIPSYTHTRGGYESLPRRPPPTLREPGTPQRVSMCANRFEKAKRPSVAMGCGNVHSVGVYCMVCFLSFLGVLQRIFGVAASPAPQRISACSQLSVGVTILRVCTYLRSSEPVFEVSNVLAHLGTRCNSEAHGRVGGARRRQGFSPTPRGHPPDARSTVPQGFSLVIPRPWQAGSQWSYKATRSVAQ
jgi:hypothetical protein